MKVLNVKSIYPTDRPDYNEWCKEFKFGVRCAEREGINNAQLMMSLWNGYIGMKEKFIRRTNTVI